MEVSIVWSIWIARIAPEQHYKYPLKKQEENLNKAVLLFMDLY